MGYGDGMSEMDFKDCAILMMGEQQREFIWSCPVKFCSVLH